MLHHAAGLPTMEAHLTHLRRMHALRMHRLDPRHPLRERCQNVQRHKFSKLAEALDSLPGPVELINLLRLPPWTTSTEKEAVTQALLSSGAYKEKQEQAAA